MAPASNTHWPGPHRCFGVCSEYYTGDGTAALQELLGTPCLSTGWFLLIDVLAPVEADLGTGVWVAGLDGQANSPGPEYEHSSGSPSPPCPEVASAFLKAAVTTLELLAPWKMVLVCSSSPRIIC